MINSFRKAKITTLAWTLSIAVHVVLLSIFAIVKFSNNTAPQPSAVPKVHLSQLSSVMNMSPVLPKPKIKDLLSQSNVAAGKRPIEFSSGPAVRPAHSSGGLATLSSGTSLPRASLQTAGTKFFGSVTNERKICYVVDCSGSMQGLFSRVRKELVQSISNLQGDQYFYIIFFSNDKLVESGRGKLIRASAKAKTDAVNFINRAKPGGKTNALNAIERAMKLGKSPQNRPGVIYFLTDGFDLQDDSSAAFGRALENMRKRLAPSTRINTIGFWPQDTDQRILKAVAGNSGGEFINIDN